MSKQRRVRWSPLDWALAVFLISTVLTAALQVVVDILSLASK